MTRGPLTQPRWDVSRIDAVLDVPWPALEYQRFLAQGAQADAGDSYLFSDARVRFEPWPEDVLVAVGELKVAEDEDGIRLSSPGAAREVRVRDVGREEALRVLKAVDGRTTLAELRSLCGLPRGPLEAVLRACFGVLVFAPLAVAGLEQELSGLELVRFPGAPYEIVRSYWRNMVAVRRALSRLDAELDEPEQAVSLLRRLHVVALMGDDFQSFYRPASPIARKAVHPGALWHREPRTLETPRGTLFLEGPRVNAALLGGEGYQRLVCESAGDPGALADRRELTDGGLSWGRLVRARAESDERDATWFCPPRPIRTAHWEALTHSLRSALVRARASERDATLSELADFHQRFIRLHPFQAANQSVCMNVIGYVLSISHGAGLPHLILDHLALRLTPDAYRRVFRLAAQGYVTTGSPVERWRLLGERKARFFDFVQRVSACADQAQAERLVASEPENARLALIGA